MIPSVDSGRVGPASRTARLRRRWGLLLLLYAAVLTLGATSAQARGTFSDRGALPVHSALVSVVPADKSVLDRGPSEIVLTFNEDIAPSFAQVAVSAEAAGAPPGGSGSAGVVATSPVAVSGRVARVTLTPPGPGTYRIAYRVVSADGHPISGESTFAVRGATVPSTGPGGSGSPTTSPAAQVSTAPAPGIPPTQPSGGSTAAATPQGTSAPASADARPDVTGTTADEGRPVLLAGVGLILLAVLVGGWEWRRRR